MRLRYTLTTLLLGVLLTCTATAQSVPPENDDPLSFSADVLPVLQTEFAPLLENEPGLDLSSWETLIAGSDNGEVLIPFDADRSLLIELATEVDPVAVNLVRRWIEEGARNDDGEVPYADAEHLLYVANQGSAVISVIDMEANLVMRTVDLQEFGFSPNANPHHIVVEPDGSHWYVSLIGANRVLKFNRDHELVAQAEFETPGMLALHPTEDLLLVGRSMMAVSPPQRIGVVQRSSMEIDELDVFFPRPHALAVHPEGTHVYTASLAENRMASVDLDEEDVTLESLDGPTHTLVQFALTPDGKTMIAGGQLTGQLLIFDMEDPGAPVVVDSVNVNAAPWHPVVTPDGRYAYFGNKMANTVTVFDLEKREVAKVIEGNGLSQPHGSAVSPDGRYVYISNNNLKGAYTPRYPLGDATKTGTVTVIDTETQKIVKVLEVETYPSGLGARQ